MSKLRVGIVGSGFGGAVHAPAFALHPRLPARTEGRAHDYVLVLDSSQSMVGERWQRASSVAFVL